MSFRHEWKYLVSSRQESIISKRLDLICTPDSNAVKEGGYTVSSLYFDDYKNSAYAAKMAGCQSRKKFRIRIYNDSDSVIKLERKVKEGWGVKKDSVLISRAEYEEILHGFAPHSFTAECPVKNDFHRLRLMRGLAPKLVVTYHRIAYVYPYGNVRICFDKALRTPRAGWDLFDQGLNHSVLASDQIIFEVKYTGFLPGHIKSAIQSGLGTKQALSKHAKCVSISKKGWPALKQLKPLTI